MCPCEGPKQKWFIDEDNDNFDNGVAYFDIFVYNPGPQYKLATLGPDCDDNNTNVQKINSCGVCAVEPSNGKCPCKTSAVDLIAMFPSLTDAKATQLADLLNKHMASYGIDTKEKLQHFLAQAGHESDSFKSFKEYTNFQPKNIMSGNFKKYFNNIGQDNAVPSKTNLSSIYTAGNKYVDGQKYLNIIYDDRNPIRSKDNLLGNTQDGDGYKFRGRGALHVTGRENYTKFTTCYNNISGLAAKDFRNTPDDLIYNFEIAIHASLWFFQKYVLNAIPNFQNKAINTDVVVIKKLTDKVSKAVNGGSNGLTDRENILKDSTTKIKCN
jgi:putative chitinase